MFDIFEKDMKANNGCLIEYKNIETYDVDYMSQEQARARWLL